MSERRFLEAFWETRDRGLAVLAGDWLDDERLPPLRLEPGDRDLRLIRRVPAMSFARRAGYCVDGGELVFVLWPPFYQNLDCEGEEVYVAGDFNGWEKAAGKAAWRMKREMHDGQMCLVLRVPPEKILPDSPTRFKFVTGEGRWQELPIQAPNRSHQGDHINYVIEPGRTGRHMFYFWTLQPHRLMEHDALAWAGSVPRETCPINNSDYLLSLGTERPLGAAFEADRTTFRLFAPRATRVTLRVYDKPGSPAVLRVDLIRHEDGCWEAIVPENLHGFYYDYSVEGENIHTTRLFDASAPVLDPYATVTVGPAGPGLLQDPARLPAPRQCFIPPAWHDLVIVEAHVRDLLAHAPLDLRAEERRGFAGLTRWLREPDCYLRELGVNAVELLPVQEFSYQHPSEYHWGYMPVNFFSPASAYSSDPARGTQAAELGELVEALHAAGMAVIFDVVYNHSGDPNHLIRLDKYYFFECDHEGRLSNWSGCGNDLRASTPMGRRLIIDSLTHLVRTYDVDGFRFDLADLIGVATLQEIEAALKAVKPSIILIAEPWSFKGHIGHALRHTGYASWNDGFREFVTQYILGHGHADGLFHFLTGSPGHVASWPAQTVNYVQSHDDHTWLDRITENHGHRGGAPTANDLRRHHLMVAILMASLGIPMFAQGQDLLHSKEGVHNTYQRGDLNALDYHRAASFPSYNAYFRQWIKFRRSPAGAPFRHADPPPEGYFARHTVPAHAAAGLLYNANFSVGRDRLLFAVNPHSWPVSLETHGLSPGDFRQIADQERFQPGGLEAPHFYWRGGKIELPPLSVGLWRQEG